MFRPIVATCIVMCQWGLPLFAQAIPAPVRGRNTAVVFDIDGTLTPNVYAIWAERRDASQAVTLYADAGFEIIYLSARVGLFQSGIPAWLADHGFPAGQIHLAATKADHDAPAQFKADIMNSYQAQGWAIVAGYGDSSSDFAAYAAVGIPGHRVFALRRDGRDSCMSGVWRGCFDQWSDLTGTIATIIDEAHSGQ